MAFIYAQRLLEFAIRIGFDDLQKDTDLLASIFAVDENLGSGRDLEAQTEPLVFEEFQQRLSQIPRREVETGIAGSIFRTLIPTLQDIQTLMATANIQIIHGYPRTASDCPCISITLGGEQESQYLGDLKGRSIKGDKAYLHLGAEMSAQYRLAVMTTNADETELWYHIVKYALLRYRPHLEGYGLTEQKVSWMDLEPAEEYLQSGLFMYQRVCMFDCMKQESVPILDKGYDTLVWGGIVGDPEIVPEKEVIPGQIELGPGEFVE
jgi:hypothetical protein